MTEEEFKEKYKDINFCFSIPTEVMEKYIENYNSVIESFKTNKKDFKKDFKNYLKKEGIDLPQNFGKFIFWYEELNPDANFNDIKQALNDSNTFIKFDEYQKRKLKNPNWTIIKEAEFVKNAATNTESIPATQQEKKVESQTKKIILEKFETFDKNNWKYAFQNEIDFNLFIEILTNYFECKEYSLPKNLIILKRGSKTKTAKVLGEIQKELSQKNLSNDTEFFKILRVISYFEKDPEKDLYKALTR